MVTCDEWHRVFRAVGKGPRLLSSLLIWKNRRHFLCIALLRDEVVAATEPDTNSCEGLSGVWDPTDRRGKKMSPS
jgi:hypothetical protein